MKTFADLYIFLQSYSENSILAFLEDKNDKWVGKEKQESLFRLFAYLSLVPEFIDYAVCDGNYNLGTIAKNTERIKLFQKHLNDKGDKSDLTLIRDKAMIVTSSKNYAHYGINDLDIDNLHSIYLEKYKPNHFTCRMCLVVPCKKILYKIVDQSEKTSLRLKEQILDKTTLVYDWNDLGTFCREFKKTYASVTYSDMIKCVKTPLVLRFHQHVSVTRTLELLKSHTQILWGHIPRSGKTYIMGGAITASSNNNFLIITTAPNETYKQYNDMLFDKYAQYDNFNIINLNGSTKKPKLTIKNIVIVSKQFLQTKGVKEDKIKEIKWLKDIDFQMRFIDESHNGGTTELASKIMETYGAMAKTVFITATYSKPCNTYNIPKEAWITWDMEDIKLCKTITHDASFERLVSKHGSVLREIYSNYTNDEIMKTYSDYPDLHLMTWDFKNEVKDAILSTYKDSNHGFSTDSIFLLKHKATAPIEEFQDDESVLKLCHTIFGKTDDTGLFTLKTSDSIFDRIERIAKNANVNSRWFTVEEPLTVLAFMPCGLQNTPIDMLHTTFMALLKRKNVLPDFEIVCINTKVNGGSDAVTIIEDARTNTKRLGKKGLLVLSGRMCSLAVSIPHCDIVLMLNNTESLDSYFQMMYRCMTEAKNKKVGFVVDLNLQRVSSVIIDYAMRIATLSTGENLTTKQAIKYIFEQRLIGLNNDNWMHDYFGLTSVNIETIVEKLYTIYASKPSNAIESIMRTLEFKVKIMESDQKLFNQIFHTTASPKDIKEVIEELTRDTEVKKGIDILEVESQAGSETSTASTKSTKDVNIISDVIKHLLPLMCLLTIHADNSNTFDAMCDFIEQSNEEKDVLITQLSTWWGNKSGTGSIMALFRTIYNKYLISNGEFKNAVMRLKEMFSVSKSNSDELSKLIDKYLIPHELEKKQNAEVSTPYSLRQQMVGTIPLDFWTQERKVFEPCVGKGGFLLDIISHFMEGLKYAIEDREERYKFIVEECLYWSDINPTNIWICRLLLDPFGKYDLKYHLGDTLKMNIKELWGIDDFDAVIGNPPYNSSGDTGTGNTIWQNFTKQSLNIFIKPNGYLLFIHPPGWRKPNSEKGKFNRLFDLMAKQNQIVYLSIHGIKDGQKTFSCGTRYDWFLIEKRPVYKNTIIKDEKNVVRKINMMDFNWLPNYNIETVHNLLVKHNEERCPIIQSMSAYEPRKKWMSDKKTDEFRYPCIHSTPKSGIRYMYSNVNDKGFFGISKVIFGDSGIYNPVLDMVGEYGMTQHAMGIIIDSFEDGKNLCQILQSDKMRTLIDSCMYSSYAIDWNIFKDFRKDFWKEFI